MRLLVYTCVFGGYDRVFPPAEVEPDTDYVLLTDDPTLAVEGWRTVVVEPCGVRGNRRYKMLGHRNLGEYAASVYVDGNIRVLGAMRDFVARFLDTGMALGLYRHPLRASVREEVAACLRANKVEDGARMTRELDEYLADGFPDDGVLVESGIVLKRHGHPALEPAMDLWWQLFERHRTRDQISLPYVLWKLGTPCRFHDGSFRDPNPHFGIYPHRASGVSGAYLYLSARAHDAAWARAALALWHAKWTLQRRLRRRAGRR
jgi:hypothetical protein